jgi:hypothetical protein
MFLRNVGSLSELHGVETRNIVFFIVMAVKTSNARISMCFDVLTKAKIKK